jgi:hypothetical protein
LITAIHGSVIHPMALLLMARHWMALMTTEGLNLYSDTGGS